MHFCLLVSYAVGRQAQCGVPPESGFDKLAPGWTVMLYQVPAFALIALIHLQIWRQCI